MVYDVEKIMTDILDNWDNSIFYYGGDTSLAGYTKSEYQLLGYSGKEEFLSDIFFQEFHYSNTIQQKGTYINIGQGLNDDDKDLLIEHSHPLFSSVSKKDNLYKYMLKLALYVNRYRYLKSKEEIINKLNHIGILSPKKHYTTKEKEDKLKKCASDIILLMGGDTVIRSNILVDLKNMILNPHMYLQKKTYHIAIPKKAISTYLFSLNLKKPKEINNFITSIK